MDQNDRYGTCSEYFNLTSHLIGCGVSLVSHDKDSILSYKTSEKFFNAAEKVCALLTSGDCLLADALNGVDDKRFAMRNTFRAGNALFYVGGIEQMLIFRDLETDLGRLLQRPPLR